MAPWRHGTWRIGRSWPYLGISVLQFSTGLVVLLVLDPISIFDISRPSRSLSRRSFARASSTRRRARPRAAAPLVAVAPRVSLLKSDLRLATSLGADAAIVLRLVVTWLVVGGALVALSWEPPAQGAATRPWRRAAFAFLGIVSLVWVATVATSAAREGCCGSPPTLGGGSPSPGSSPSRSHGMPSSTWTGASSLRPWRGLLGAGDAVAASGLPLWAWASQERGRREAAPMGSGGCGTHARA